MNTIEHEIPIQGYHFDTFLTIDCLSERTLHCFASKMQQRWSRIRVRSTKNTFIVYNLAKLYIRRTMLTSQYKQSGRVLFLSLQLSCGADQFSTGTLKEKQTGCVTNDAF